MRTMTNLNPTRMKEIAKIMGDHYCYRVIEDDRYKALLNQIAKEYVASLPLEDLSKKDLAHHIVDRTFVISFIPGED